MGCDRAPCLLREICLAVALFGLATTVWAEDTVAHRRGAVPNLDHTAFAGRSARPGAKHASGRRGTTRIRLHGGCRNCSATISRFRMWPYSVPSEQQSSHSVVDEAARSRPTFGPIVRRDACAPKTYVRSAATGVFSVFCGSSQLMASDALTGSANGHSHAQRVEAVHGGAAAVTQARLAAPVP
jgi:hypothetical protein